MTVIVSKIYIFSNRTKIIIGHNNTQAWTSSVNSFSFHWPQHCHCFLYSQNNWAIVANLLFWPTNLLNLIFKWWDYTAIIHSTKNIHTERFVETKRPEVIRFQSIWGGINCWQCKKIQHYANKQRTAMKLTVIIADIFLIWKLFWGRNEIFSFSTVIIEPYYMWLNSYKLSGWS